ncbi:MAG: hypothetical protein ACRETG_02450 [Steroidobacteraceae bacterium]
MRVTSWAIVGSLLINLAFGLIVAAASATRPAAAGAPPLCAHRHSTVSPRHEPVSRYLAAARMGWAIG